MTELEQILEAQRRWAAERGIPVDAKGRTPAIDDNLFRPLHPQTRAEFEKGAGNELAEDMRSLRSSAALACNVFDPWRERPLRALAAACGAEPGLAGLRFEATFPTGLRGTPPHLDVLLEGGGTPTAIESKFTEIYSPGRHAGFADSYFQREDLWASWPRVGALARAIRKHEVDFGPLDAAQLVKHALGLRKAFGEKGYRLLYLWYDAGGPVATDHRKAIARFREETHGEIPFDAMTYQELFGRLRTSGEADPEHLAYLEERYSASPADRPR